MEERIKWYKKAWGKALIVFAVLVLSVLSAISFYFIKLVENARNNPEITKIANSDGYNQNIDKTLVEGTKNYWIGTDRPKVTIVEFADYSCSQSRKSFQKIRELSYRKNSEIKFIYRDFPVISEFSTRLAMAGRCAGEQGFFWPMHDKLFLTENLSSDSQLYALAASIGADQKKFKECLDSDKYLYDIQKDYSDGNLLEIGGTPTWYINGYKIEGDVPYYTWVDILDRLLE